VSVGRAYSARFRVAHSYSSIYVAQSYTHTYTCSSRGAGGLSGSTSRRPGGRRSHAARGDPPVHLQRSCVHEAAGRCAVRRVKGARADAAEHEQQPRKGARRERPAARLRGDAVRLWAASESCLRRPVTNCTAPVLNVDRGGAHACAVGAHATGRLSSVEAAASPHRRHSAPAWSCVSRSERCPRVSSRCLRSLGNSGAARSALAARRTPPTARGGDAAVH
jgi:hypothetical protein